MVRLIIEDDGQGFEADTMTQDGSVKRKVGLLGMRERVAGLDGTLTIESTPGQGMMLYIQIPR